MGPIILGSTLSGLDVLAVAMVLITTLVALATACVMNFILTCLFTCHLSSLFECILIICF